MRLTRTVGILALALTSCPPPPASGQVPPPDTTGAIPIAGVTVTVTRMPIALARVPYSLSVNGEREIRRGKPGLALDEAMRGIPGVQVDNRYNYALGERISIRGFGARAQFGVRGIRVLVDGIPATFPDGQTSLSHVDMGLLSRAEVIRGPASALYGNTAGGVVQLETRPPPPTRFAQEVGVTAGADGLVKLYAGAGGRNGGLGYRLDASRLDYGGFREFSSARSSRLNGHLGYTGARDELTLTVSAVEYDARNPGSLTGELLREDRTQAFAFNEAQRAGEDGRQAQVGGVWRRTTVGGELELAAYAISREIANPIPNTIIDLDRATGGARALFRGGTAPVAGADHVAGEDAAGVVRWTLGMDADLQRDDRLNHDNEQGERGALTLDQRERVTNLAGFAQLAVTPVQRLTLLGGVRYDWFRFAADDRLVTAENPDDSGAREMDAVSPSVGATYTFGDALTVFGNAATSFETPTTTELANRPSGAGGFNPELQPQEAVSLEIGTRGVLGRRLAYQAAAYRTGVENSLIPFQVPEAEGRDFFRNAGSAVHRGVELSATADLARGLRLKAAYTRTDARFDRYEAGGETHDGNRVPGIAPNRLDVLASYDFRSGWYLAADSRYVSRMPVDDANAFTSPAYAVTDVRAGADRIRVGTVEVAPFIGVSNLFGEEYNTSVTVNAFGRRYFEPGPGRAMYGGAMLRLGR